MNIVFHIVFFTVVKLLCPTLYVQRICIALSIDGHLGCFRTLAIVDNAAVNVLGHISFQISGLDFFRLIPGCGIAGSYGISIFNFFRNCHTVSIVATLIYNPTGSAGGLPFLHIITNTCCSLMY